MALPCGSVLLSHTASDVLDRWATVVPTPETTHVLTTQQVCCNDRTMTSQEFKRWLEKQGCTFEPGHGGHLIVRLGERMSVLPMHGKQKDLGTGLVNSIKKDLSLK